MPKSVSFGKQEFGNVGAHSKPKRITLKNLGKGGGSAVQFGAPAVSGAFVLTSVGCAGELAAGATCVDEVAYVPDALGDQAGTLNIVSNVSSPPSVALKGKGVPPSIKIKPAKLGFGKIPAGSASAQLSTQITNTSSVPVTITSVAATPPFNVTGNTCDVVGPGETCVVSVEFAPQSAGKFKGTLQIVDNAARQPQKINLVGTAQ